MSHPIRRRLAAAVFRMLGWKIEFNGLPAKRGVIVAYPHTSNWDFPLGLLAIWSIELELKFVGKHTLFRWPLGFFMRRWGGLPIDRRSPQGAIGALAELIREQPTCWVAIAPEGTRRCTAGWRTGFYHLARRLEAPLGLGVIDYATRRVMLTEFIELGGDAEPADVMREIARYYAPYRGLKPENASPIEWIETRR